MTTKNTDTSDILAKVIIVGDSGVGKTNLLTSFCEGVFKQSYVATIGVDFKIKVLDVDGKRMKLQIWDTAGQQRFRNITQTYYKGALGIILAYSICDIKSFQNVGQWVKQIEANSEEDVCLVLIGNKSDLEEDRCVTSEEGNALAKKYGMSFFQVSGKTRNNVNECFMALARKIKGKIDQSQRASANTRQKLVIRGDRKKQKNCDC